MVNDFELNQNWNSNILRIEPYPFLWNYRIEMNCIFFSVQFGFELKQPNFVFYFKLIILNIIYIPNLLILTTFNYFYRNNLVKNLIMLKYLLGINYFTFDYFLKIKKTILVKIFETLYVIRQTNNISQLYIFLKNYYNLV